MHLVDWVSSHRHYYHRRHVVAISRADCSVHFVYSIQYKQFILA
jgi:hypothetical protein